MDPKTLKRNRLIIGDITELYVKSEFINCKPEDDTIDGNASDTGRYDCDASEESDQS